MQATKANAPNGRQRICNRFMGRFSSSALESFGLRPARVRQNPLGKDPVEQPADDQPFERVVRELAAALDALADEAQVIRDAEDPVERADAVSWSVLVPAGADDRIAKAAVQPRHEAARQRALDVAEKDYARQVG